jgi:ketosteroid isomerase-like protein
MQRRILNVITVTILMLTPHTYAQSQTAEAAAHKTLATFIAAWNNADNPALREVMNFPFTTLVGSKMTIADEPEDFATDFQDMVERQGWARSTFDTTTITYSAPEKVHANVAYTRYKKDGTPYASSHVFYIITKKDDHWGIQFRAPGTLITDNPTPEQTLAIESATQAIKDFYEAVNSADNSALLKTLNLPHAFLFGNGTLLPAHQPDGPGATMDFDRMKRNEGWHMSSIDALTPINASPDSVTFEIIFSRYHKNGLKYRTVPALWVLTNKDGHWGVQFRSLMPATFSE